MTSGHNFHMLQAKHVTAKIDALMDKFFGSCLKINFINLTCYNPTVFLNTDLRHPVSHRACQAGRA